MVAARGGVLAACSRGGQACGATPGERNGPASTAARARRPRPPRARTPPAALALARHGGPRRAGASRRSRSPTASRGATARELERRARDREASAPRRRAARGAAARPRAPHFVCQGEGIHAKPGGLPSPLTVLEQPPALAEELPHHRASLPAASVVGGGSGETQPRGDDGPRVYWVAPRGLGVPRRPGLHSRAARRLATKTRAVNRRGFA